MEGSEVLELLEKLERQGAEIMVCGTCLDYYNMKDKLKVGKVSNMYEVPEKLLSCEKVTGI